jgi:hypothetical protein
MRFMPAADRRRSLTFAGVVIATAVGCDGIEATEMPREPPAVVAFDGPPCGDEIVVHPLDVDVRWRRELGLAGLAFAETAAGAMLVLSDYSGAWWRLELDASPIAVRRGAPPMPAHGDFDLAPGSRWAYAATVRDGEDVEIAFRDLHSAGPLVLVDPSPRVDYEPVVAPRPEGGWAVAWIRSEHPGPMELRLALIDAGGTVLATRAVDTAAVIHKVRLEPTRDGHALVYVRASEVWGPTQQVVVRLLDRTGVPADLQVLADGKVNSPRAARGPDGLAVTYVRDRGLFEFVILDHEGTPSGSPRRVHVEQDRQFAHGWATALLHHRGRYWLGAEVHYSARDSQVAPSLTFVIPLASDGRPGQLVELARSNHLADDLVLGRSVDGVLAAWSEGRGRTRLRVVELRCQ